ncbi:MAG: prolipoprotein diacylglyceryl transferase [Gammaproteobacteria bacterium]|nr:prolipoprotein diacylglyceryl transferase [Gammaproteobacteria bacterium]
MFTYPEIDHVLLSIGPLKVHWYGVMYIFGFLSAWLLGIWRAKKSESWDNEQVADLVLYGALGAVLGGRLGYILFYKLGYYLAQPLDIFRIWEGGMSFHGGLIGVLVAIWLFGRKTDRSFFQVSDFVAPLVPIGLFFGRIGNFINQELWGRVTDVSWGMVFPLAGTMPRHPSQLYEAALEGLVLFVVLWVYSSAPRPVARVSGLFLVLYGSFRFIVEFTREPDYYLGFVALDWMTMGQVLSLPMIVFGLLIMWLSGNQRLDYKGEASKKSH